MRWTPRLLFLTFATSAFASDGVLEISQTCAVQTGCFAGDTAGFPVTIDGSTGHSYRLTSDLTIPDENTDGIQVNASDVGIDLNNFSIIRSACVGATTNCATATGTGSGLKALVGYKGLSVRDGSITGMGSNGVQLGEQAEVRNLRVRWNRADGINVDVASTISGNTLFQNGGDGISAGIGSTISGNTVYDNGGNGIRASNDSTISANTGTTNGGDGILASVGCSVQRNTLRLNAGFGLNLGLQSTFRGNTLTVNSTGPVSGGVNQGGNFCFGAGTVSASCP